MRLQVGLYVVYLLDWLTVFDKGQILVLRLEDHASNVKYTMHVVFQFLDLGRHHLAGLSEVQKSCLHSGLLMLMERQHPRCASVFTEGQIVLS